MIRTLTPLFSIIVAIALYLVFTQSQYIEIKSLQSQIASYHNAIESYENFGYLLQEKVSEKVSRSAYESEQLDLLVPKEIDETRILVDLDKLAGGHNLLLQSVAVEKATKPEVDINFSEAESIDIKDRLAIGGVSFTVSGTYEDFKKFLADIERSATLLEVTKISLTKAENYFQEFEVSVRTYALPE